jgi:hypothetical protein
MLQLDRKKLFKEMYTLKQTKSLLDKNLKHTVPINKNPDARLKHKTP